MTGAEIRIREAIAGELVRQGEAPGMSAPWISRDTPATILVDGAIDLDAVVAAVVHALVTPSP